MGDADTPPSVKDDPEQSRRFRELAEEVALGDRAERFAPLFGEVAAQKPTPRKKSGGRRSSTTAANRVTP